MNKDEKNRIIDEMKNRISLTLKDAILFPQQGFEIICKNLVELEKENEELKKQAKQKQHLADVRLEQSLENYKLFSDERKERIDIDIALEDMTNNLTKAKEIIRELLDTQSQLDLYRDIFKERILKAEQFLKEVEK